MAGCEPGKPIARIALYVKDAIRERSPDLYGSLRGLLEGNFEVAGPADAEVAVSVGGDGTFLALARSLPEDTPILGINMGRRGAVTDALPEDLPILVRKLKEGSYCVEDRMKLEAVLPTGSYEAINEFYLARKYEGSTPYYTFRYDSNELYSDRMDGAIISTPTGSTGYNLSAGGPVLHESMRSMVLTPVLPLTKIPSVVIPMDDHHEVEVESSSPITLLIDGQLKLDDGIKYLRVRTSRYSLKVVRLRQIHFQHLKKTMCRQ
ncbi:MAG: NAD(+)/NADH kinase [Nitrososphaeria archaeon]